MNYDKTEYHGLKQPLKWMFYTPTNSQTKDATRVPRHHGLVDGGNNPKDDITSKEKCMYPYRMIYNILNHSITVKSTSLLHLQIILYKH